MKRSMIWILLPALLFLPALEVWADAPAARFGHSMVNPNGDVYLFGGMVPLQGDRDLFNNDRRSICEPFVKLPPKIALTRDKNGCAQDDKQQAEDRCVESGKSETERSEVRPVSRHSRLLGAD